MASDVLEVSSRMRQERKNRMVSSNQRVQSAYQMNAHEARFRMLLQAFQILSDAEDTEKSLYVDERLALGKAIAAFAMEGE